MNSTKKPAGSKTPVNLLIPGTTEAAVKNLALYWDCTQHGQIIPQKILTLLAKAVKDDWRKDALSREIIGLIGNQEHLREGSKAIARKK